jgi:hypothetical protein
MSNRKNHKQEKPQVTTGARGNERNHMQQEKPQIKEIRETGNNKKNYK